MKAFKLHNLYQDTISQKALAVFSMSQTKEVCFTEKTFDNIDIAKQYIYSCKKDWLLNCLEKFILHKKQIWHNSNNAVAQNSVRICYDTYLNFEGQILEKICKRVVAGADYFNNILPSPNNDSHQSSVENLKEIMSFCNNEVAQLKHI